MRFGLVVAAGALAAGSLAAAGCAAPTNSASRASSMPSSASEPSSMPAASSTTASSTTASSTTATGPPASGPAVSSAPLPSDQSVEQRLWALAVGTATANQGSVKDAQAVRSTHAAAVLLTSQDIVYDDQPVWVIQVEGTGEFVCDGCSVPPGGSAPHGRFFTLIVGATTFRTTDFGLGSTKADLSKLGNVINLHG